MKFILIILLFINLLFSNVKWSYNYDEALKNAQMNHKRIYMLIVSDSCGWCRKFKKLTLSDKLVLKRLSEKYELLLLNRNNDFIPKKFKTSPIPRYYFLTSNGKIVFPVVGYRDVESFNKFLDDVEKRYKRIER